MAAASTSAAPPSRLGAPLLALGMNTAPFNHVKRRLVRETMLQHRSVQSGRVTFRFVVGSTLVPKVVRTTAKAASSTAQFDADCAALKEEEATHTDILRVDALDGSGVAMECPAAEKTIQWLRHASRAWPNAIYIGKTEDDTFVHVDMLALELDRLTAMKVPNIVYGLFGICSMPKTARAERLPSGFKACFLGSLERVGWVTGAYRSLVQWRQGGANGGGGAHGMQRKCAPGSAEPAPFPTGPLAVFSAGLAHKIFSGCAYLEHAFQYGRAANRRTLCRGRDKQHSWASLVGDCALGHWMSQCARGLNVTIAHMTYTKAHHYAINAGGQGWVAPSNNSIAVHWLKRHTGPSGPTRTEGGEWSHVRDALESSTGPGFPPLLWRYRPDQVLRSWRLLDEALNVDVHAFYARACGVWHETVKAHSQRLRRRVARCAAGGSPDSWPFYGCHPSRGYRHPIWPAAPGSRGQGDNRARNGSIQEEQEGDVACAKLYG